jgi:hypothetical protein
MPITPATDGKPPGKRLTEPGSFWGRFAEMLDTFAPIIAIGASVVAYYFGRALGRVSGDAAFAMLASVSVRIGAAGDLAGFVSVLAVGLRIGGALTAAGWILGLAKWEIQFVGWAHRRVRRKIIERRYAHWVPIVSSLTGLLPESYGDHRAFVLQSMRAGMSG